MTSAATHSTISRQDRSTRTAELFARLAECEEAERDGLIDELVMINSGVAQSVARRYRGRGIDVDDLYQVACEGLVKAVRRFDPQLRHDFMSYAVPTIRGELQRHFRDRGWVVRPPRRVQELQGEINKALERVTQTLGHEPSHQDLAAELGIDDSAYAEAMSAFGCFQPASLDRPVSDDFDDTLGSLMAAEVSEGSEARLTLQPVVRRLPERDRRILYLRFFEERTQREIGDELGVTQMQVSRLLTRILSQLREDLGDAG